MFVEVLMVQLTARLSPARCPLPATRPLPRCCPFHARPLPACCSPAVRPPKQSITCIIFVEVLMVQLTARLSRASRAPLARPLPTRCPPAVHPLPSRYPPAARPLPAHCPPAASPLPFPCPPAARPPPACRPPEIRDLTHVRRQQRGSRLLKRFYILVKMSHLLRYIQCVRWY